METALISVVVSAYNAEATIVKCIDSILDQTFGNFQLIIVDDGSSDNTARIVDDFATKDARILVVHKSNGGLTSARKAGFEIATGEYISFVDSDDFLEPDYLGKLYQAMDGNTDVVIASYYVDNNSHSIVKQFEPDSVKKEDFVKRFILPSIYYLEDIDEAQYPDFVWLRLYRKRVISDACFVSERICYTEDLFFQFHVLECARAVRIIDKPLYHYIANENSLTAKYRVGKWNMVKNRYNMVEEFCQSHSIAVEPERMKGLQLISIVGCVHNAMNANDYQCFRDECKQIREDYQDFFQRIHVKHCSQRHKLICALLKFRCYKILYALMR